MLHHHKLEFQVKNHIAVYKVKVTAKVWNVNEYLSRRYLLSCSTFCNQTLCGGHWVLSWARLLRRKIALLSSRSRSCEGLYNQNMTVFNISSTLVICLEQNLLWRYVIINLMSCKKLDCCFQGQDTGECLNNIFWNTKPFNTKFSIVMHHHELDCPMNYEKTCSLSSRSRSQCRLHMVK